MADNFPLTPGAGRNAATDQATYSGDLADVQLMRRVHIKGSEGSKTVVEIPPYKLQEDTVDSEIEGTAIDCQDNPLMHWTLVVSDVGGTTTSWSVQVLGSLDNLNWGLIMAMHRSTHGEPGLIATASRIALRWAKVEVTELTIGSATGIKLSLMGTP